MSNKSDGQNVKWLMAVMSQNVCCRGIVKAWCQDEESYANAIFCFQLGRRLQHFCTMRSEYLDVSCVQQEIVEGGMLAGAEAV
ncbi:hypothetical protein T4D_7575 [Trichinella pseudospiralis]|uniref:Uncharacterized protein n=1 Tax=Trichinella pseudospiralis TaxID=6337 RepID=A0A0V1FWL8_TRIPS|nr:hypothetical protein T4D_7575 [Trichinella pseudospiralis]